MKNAFDENLIDKGMISSYNDGFMTKLTSEPKRKIPVFQISIIIPILTIGISLLCVKMCLPQKKK